MRVTVLLTQTAVWSGIATATAAHGVERTWAMLCFALVSAYVQVPMLFMRTSPRVAKRQARGSTVSSVSSGLDSFTEPAAVR